jgi:hypothetical protein
MTKLRDVLLGIKRYVLLNLIFVNRQIEVKILIPHLD